MLNGPERKGRRHYLQCMALLMVGTPAAKAAEWFLRRRKRFAAAAVVAATPMNRRQFFTRSFGCAAMIALPEGKSKIRGVSGWDAAVLASGRFPEAQKAKRWWRRWLLLKAIDHGGVQDLKEQVQKLPDTYVDLVVDSPRAAIWVAEQLVP